jgi:hypothetical protein
MVPELEGIDYSGLQVVASEVAAVLGEDFAAGRYLCELALSEGSTPPQLAALGLMAHGMLSEPLRHGDVVAAFPEYARGLDDPIASYVGLAYLRVSNPSRLPLDKKHAVKLIDEVRRFGEVSAMVGASAAAAFAWQASPNLSGSDPIGRARELCLYLAS